MKKGVFSLSLPDSLPCCICSQSRCKAKPRALAGPCGSAVFPGQAGWVIPLCLAHAGSSCPASEPHRQEQRPEQSGARLGPGGLCSSKESAARGAQLLLELDVEQESHVDPLSGGADAAAWPYRAFTPTETSLCTKLKEFNTSEASIPLPNLVEAGQQAETNAQALGSGGTLPPLGSHAEMPPLQAVRCFQKDLESERANKCTDLTVSPACLCPESLC